MGWFDLEWVGLRRNEMDSFDLGWVRLRSDVLICVGLG